MHHFNAFISYKHADLDNKIAESIVRDLEHYHIPKKIQKATGVKKIERVFRDKDELPITSDLNDTISQALANSDYLIVICSSNTSKSVWVEREIEFFLRNHTLNNVLTVLCDSEPYEVVPKVLLNGKREVVDEEGNKHFEDVPYEPLSCDYRMPRREARAKELPRLVAAIIGCSYDELIDRQRQYKMRRMSAIFGMAAALSLGFAGYMFYSKALIHENYVESLRNQSRYLANESAKQLEDKKRIDAMQLALAALPSGEGDDRPVIPEAEQAIINATLSYVSPTGLNISAVWNFSMPNDIQKFELSEDGSRISAIDYNNVISVWDVESRKQLFLENKPDNDLNGTFFYNNDIFIVVRSEKIYAYDLNKGEYIWENDSCQDLDSCRNILVLDDGNIMVVGVRGTFTKLSIKDGAVISVNGFYSTEEDKYYRVYELDSIMSDDKSKIAVYEQYNEDYDNPELSVKEYDINTGEVLTYPLEGNAARTMKYFGDKLMVSTRPFGQDGTTGVDKFTFVTDMETKIICLQSGSLEKVWEDSIVDSDVPAGSDFLKLGNGNILYYEGDIGKVWNKDTGKVIEENKLNDTIVDASDVDGDGEPMYVTRGGTTANPGTFMDAYGMQYFDRFSSDLIDARLLKHFFTLQYLSKDIICYDIKTYDDEWNQIEDMPAYKHGSDKYYMDDDILAVLVEEGEGTKMILVDPQNKTYLGDVVLGEDTPKYSYTILGAYEGKVYLTYDDYKSISLVTVDIESKEAKTDVLNADYHISAPMCALNDGKIIYMDNFDYETVKVKTYDLSSGEETDNDISYERIDEIRYFAEAEKCYLISDVDMILDTRDFSVTTFEATAELNGTKDVAINSAGDKVAVTDNDRIIIMNMKGEILSDISRQGVEPNGITFHETEKDGEFLLVNFKTGTLVRYNPDTGENLGTTDIAAYSMSFANGNFEFDDEKDLLFVNTGYLMDVVDAKSWLQLCYIENCFGYNKKTDSFLTYGFTRSQDESYVGWFKHYSIDDLIAKAKNHLGDAEMSDGKKSIYGIQ